MENVKTANYLTQEAVAEKEMIAGVTRKNLEERFADLPKSGIVEMDKGELEEFLIKNLEFRRRTEELERDEGFKQLITYFLIRNSEEKYLLSQRKARGGEARAHGAYLFGYGGHTRKSDIDGPLKQWLRREFDEEVYTEVVRISFLGLLNDDSEEMQRVNRVHFGLVFLVDVGEAAAELKEKEKFEPGRFTDLAAIHEHWDRLETWSRVVWLKLAG